MVETFNCAETSLRRDARGEKVKLLQTHLKTLGYYVQSGGRTLAVDGIFGIYTEQAVKAFQKSLGNFLQDGWFGEKTCKKLNEKILAKESETKKTEEEKKKSTATTKTVTKPMVDPYAPNKKNNIYREGNIDIDGIRLIASSVTRTNSFHSGGWKTIQLMNGKNYMYKDRPSPYEYSIDCYIKNIDWGKIYVELNKMGERICKVNTKLFHSGYYVLDVTVADEKVESKKVTIKFIEYMV